MENNNQIDTIKVILLGEAGTGKTCLINVYDTNKFDEKTTCTITSSFICKTLDINERKCKVHLWDTAGSEEYRSVNKIYIKGAHIVILVYDITRRSTFNELSFWFDYTLECISKNEATFGVVGNKIDLYDKEKEIKDKDPNVEFDLVMKKEGSEYADKIGASFIETSAKENAPGFAELIKQLVEEYYSKNKNTRKNNNFDLENQQRQNITKVKKNKCC